jgi:aldose 1-epimerase
VTVEATNLSPGDLPFGYAAHPYFTVGEAEVDEVEVTMPAASYLEVDDRLLPLRISPVTGTDKDLRAGTAAGPDQSGHRDDRPGPRCRRPVARPPSVSATRSPELWADETMNWLQIFTGGPYRDWSLAVEPMTCGPDAFNPGPTHDGHDRAGPGRVLHRFLGRPGKLAADAVLGKELDS